MGKHRNDASGRTYNDGKGPGYKNPMGEKWVKGQSGNPSGSRVKKRKPLLDKVAESFHEALDQVVPTSAGNKVALLDGLVQQLCQGSVNDSKSAVRLVDLIINLERTRSAATAVEEPDDDLPDAQKELLERTIERLLEARQMPRRHTPEEAQNEPTTSGFAEAARDVCHD